MIRNRLVGYVGYMDLDAQTFWLVFVCVVIDGECTGICFRKACMSFKIIVVGVRKCRTRINRQQELKIFITRVQFKYFRKTCQVLGFRRESLYFRFPV